MPEIILRELQMPLTPTLSQREKEFVRAHLRRLIRFPLFQPNLSRYPFYGFIIGSCTHEQAFQTPEVENPLPAEGVEEWGFGKLRHSKIYKLQIPRGAKPAKIDSLSERRSLCAHLCAG